MSWNTNLNSFRVLWDYILSLSHCRGQILSIFLVKALVFLLSKSILHALGWDMENNRLQCYHSVLKKVAYGLHWRGHPTRLCHIQNKRESRLTNFRRWIMSTVILWILCHEVHQCILVPIVTMTWLSNKVKVVSSGMQLEFMHDLYHNVLCINLTFGWCIWSCYCYIYGHRM